MTGTRIFSAAATGFLLLLTALAAPGARAASSVGVSSNWAGYVALPSSGQRRDFSSVSGTWRAPAATCTAGRETYSAAWTGLGGYGESSSALEQIGTEADCTRSGRASYAAWWEIVPAAPVRITMRIRPGDEVTGSATVHGHGVTLRLRDLTTGARFSTTSRSSTVDLSSAEWIVEAPSVCPSSGACTTLALADFGTVPFAGAYATAASRTGPIADGAWSDDAIELRQGEIVQSTGEPGRRQSAARVLVTATPSSASGSTGAFTVAYRERAGVSGQPQLPTLPGLATAAL